MPAFQHPSYIKMNENTEPSPTQHVDNRTLDF